MTDRPLALTLAAALLAVSLLLGAAVPASAVASPQNGSSGDSAAPFCGGTLAAATTQAGLNATVERSAARAEIRANGGALWTTTVTFANPSTATRLLADDALRRTVLDGIPRSPDVSDVTVTADGADSHSLVVRYETEAFAARTPGGLYRVDHFRSDGSDSRTFDCDSLTVVAPPGYALANDPEGAVVRADENRAVVTGAGGDGGFALVFAPTALPSPVGSALSRGALFLGVSGVVASNLLWSACLPGAAFAGGLAGCHRLLGALLGRTPSRDVAARDVGLGALALLLAGGVPAGLLFGFAADSPFLPVVAGVAVGAFLVGVGSRGPPPSVRGAFSPVALGGAVAALVAAGGVVAGVVPGSLAAASVFVATLPALGYPLGVAATSGRPARHTVAVAVVAFAAAVVAWVPMADAGGSSGPAVAFALAAALAAFAAAIPFALVGAATGGR